MPQAPTEGLRAALLKGNNPPRMQANFAKYGIKFQYPDNWTLEADQVLQGRGSVSVYSPSGGFWQVTVHEPDRDPDELVDAVVETMRGMYDELDAEETISRIAGHDVVACEMNFYYLDLTNTALVEVIPSRRATYVVMYQAEDREFDNIHRVFEAMTASLVQESPWLQE